MIKALLLTAALVSNITFANVPKSLPENDEVVSYLRSQFSSAAPNITSSELEDKVWSCQTYSSVNDSYSVVSSILNFQVVDSNVLATWSDRSEQFRYLADGSLTSDFAFTDGSFAFTTLRISKEGRLYFENGDSIKGSDRPSSIYAKNLFANNYTTCSK